MEFDNATNLDRKSGGMGHPSAAVRTVFRGTDRDAESRKFH
jgi:hypothetical protein